MIATIPVRVRTAALALAAAIALPSARAQPAYVAIPDATYERPPADPLRMPTDVTVQPDGLVCVADGVNNRVAVFASAGASQGEISRIDDDNLQRPIGVFADGAGRLWIADSGLARVVLRAADGRLERIIPLPTAQGAHAPEPTDLALTPDARALWIADNELHRVLRYDLAAGTWQALGRRGETRGDWQYPFQLALAPNGDVIATDVINGRAQLLDAAGTMIATIGGFGVTYGRLYRPTGIAVDAESNIWIADSVTGVIQVFRSTGEVIAVLRDASGAPLRFAGPMGITFDASGRLYVTERDANRVRRFRIERSEAIRELPTPGPPARLSGQQGRSCTVCHIEWLPPFSEGQDSPLMPRPKPQPQDPVVARSENCLSCHDGAVGDARRRVWLEHGHLTGVAPPDTMAVPDSLPLIDGKLSCRTCHSAHGPGVAQDDLRAAIFLRVRNDASQLCMMCHADKARGPAFGTHPTGGMPWPVPQSLIDAGAEVGPNPRELTCQVCHTPHGAKHEHLLVMGTSTNQLCIECHDQMRPGMFREGAGEHPLSPPVNAQQLAAIRELGTAVGPGDRLVCLSCHKLHHGHGKRFMLAAPLTDGDMCLHCHQDRNAMIGTAHDLRSTFPNERNRLGMTVMEGGPCSACHLFHRYARLPSPTELDPVGNCVTCHQSGQCAERKQLGEFNHRGAACLDCHNPHDTQHGHFLRDEPHKVCATCHAEQAGALLGSPHDFDAQSPCWPALSRETQDRCLACHRPHATAPEARFRIAPETRASADGACIACHREADWDAPGAQAALHPRPSAAEFDWPEELPLVFDHQHDTGRIGCRTCHDPHGGAQPGLMRRVSAPLAPGGMDACQACHSDTRTIVHVAHSAGRLSQAGFDSANCAPCHNPHGLRAQALPALISSDITALPQGATPAVFTNGRPVGATDAVTDAYCVGCHSPGGGATVPEIASHPDVPAFAVGVDQTPLPLFDDLGRPDPRGRIACRTCHLPHGRAAPEGVDPGQPGVNLRLQLRPFAAPNTCTTCHGADALRRYLYFHDPVRRKAPGAAFAPPG